MSEPIVYIDSSTIRVGKLAELKAAIRATVAYVDANEPQLLSYGFFLSENDTRMTVVAVHPDAASMEYHMKVGSPVFRRFTEFINLSRIEVYGDVPETVLEKLREKAEMLGSGRVVVHKLHAGFARFGGR